MPHTFRLPHTPVANSFSAAITVHSATAGTASLPHTVANFEGRELALIRLWTDFDTLYPASGTPLVTPGNHPVHPVGIAFKERFHSAVGKVSHPSG
jgi:hypothetical protein